MYAAGHLGLALLAFAPVGYVLLRANRVRHAALGTTVTVLLSTVPDVDLFVPALSHRGLTHTFLFALLVGVAAGVLVGVLVRASPSTRKSLALWTCLWAGLAVCSHLLGDVITPMGIRPLAPFSDAHATLGLVYARNPQANTALFVAGTVSTTATWWMATSATDGVRTPTAMVSKLTSARESVSDGEDGSR